MKDVGLLLAVLLVVPVTCCGGSSALPEKDQWIGIEVLEERVEPGKAFPLTVVRIWNRELAAAAWDEGLLAPLDLRLEAFVLDEDEHRVRETRRYRAYAFALEDVSIPAVPFAARPQGGGAVKIVHAPALRLRVAPTLAATSPGAPELPGGPLAEPPSRAPWIGLGLALLVGLGLVATRWRRPRRPVAGTPAEEPAAPAPHAIALERLGRLRSGDGNGVVAAASEIVREYVAERFDVRAPYQSTEEVLAAPAIQTEARTQRARLRELLALSDRTKFAAHAVTPAEQESHLDEAEAFVRETARGEAS